MIAPRRSAIILYLALLILVVAAIVILFRWSEQLEESPDSDAAYYSRHGIPLRDPPPSPYDIPPDDVSSSARDTASYSRLTRSLRAVWRGAEPTTSCAIFQPIGGLVSHVMGRSGSTSIRMGG